MGYGTMIVKAKSGSRPKSNKVKSPNMDEYFECRVLAIMEERRLFHKKRDIRYILVSPFSHALGIANAEEFQIVETTIPSWWITRDFGKNIYIHPNDRMSGDGSLRLCLYQGPLELMEDKSLLVDLANSNFESGEKCRSIYLHYENMDIFGETSKPAAFSQDKG